MIEYKPIPIKRTCACKVRQWNRSEEAHYTTHFSCDMILESVLKFYGGTSADLLDLYGGLVYRLLSVSRYI